MIVTQLRDAPVFGILHFGDDSAVHANLKSVGDEASEVYLRCAVLCGRSIAEHGGRYTLITNDAARARRQLGTLGVADLEVVEHRFEWDFPEFLTFPSAHRGLEVIASIGRGDYGSAAVLLDIDTVQLRPFDMPPLPAHGLTCYDVSHHRAMDARARSDVETIAGRSLREVRWWGGEFFAGSAASFARLTRVIVDCWPRYLEVARERGYSGEELILSPALSLLAEEGFPLAEAGRPGGIARWWTARTEFRQPRLSELADRSILHLPADKPFLAAASGRPFDAPAFIKAYRRHARAKLAWRRAANAIDALRGRPARHVARL